MGTMKIPHTARYRKRVGSFGGMDVKRDSSVISFSTAARCYNFDMSSGALREGYGTETHALVPNSARRYYVYRYYSDEDGKYIDQYLYQLKNGLIMCYDSKRKMHLYISGKQFPEMHAVNYRLNSADVLLLSFSDGTLKSWNGSKIVDYPVPDISSMALHYERLFVTSKTEPTKVFFSDDLDPTNFAVSSDGGGFIELLDERGNLNKVVSFGSYLYIFRDHGISRVTAFGDQREFSVVNLFVTAGRIYPSSIATCGSSVMFLASDGLYRFDGYDCVRVLENLDGLIVAGDNCSCAYHNGKYFLACGMDFGDGEIVGCEAAEHTVNGLLVLDMSTGEYSVTRGTDITFMNSCTYEGEDYLVCCDGGAGRVISRCGTRNGEPLPKVWTGADTDFGSPDAVKSVREVYIKTSVACELTLENGKKKKTLAVKPGDRRVRVNFNARRMSLTVGCAAAACTVKPPTIVYSV